MTKQLFVFLLKNQMKLFLFDNLSKIDFKTFICKY